MPTNLYRTALKQALKEEITDGNTSIADLLDAYGRKTASGPGLIPVFRDRGNGIWDGGYANGWEKVTHDLLNALKPYLKDEKVKEIGRNRREHTDTYQDSTGTYTLISRVDSGD